MWRQITGTYCSSGSYGMSLYVNTISNMSVTRSRLMCVSRYIQRYVSWTGQTWNITEKNKLSLQTRYSKLQMLIGGKQSLLYQLGAGCCWIERLLTWISAPQGGKKKEKSLCPINISSLLASSGSGEGQIFPLRNPPAHRAQPRNTHRCCTYIFEWLWVTMFRLKMSFHICVNHRTNNLRL